MTNKTATMLSKPPNILQQGSYFLAGYKIEIIPLDVGQHVGSFAALRVSCAIFAQDSDFENQS
jgi:hypothetical protein